MVCTKCGASVNAGDNFCEECGASVKQAVASSKAINDSFPKSEAFVYDINLAAVTNKGRRHPANEDAGTVIKRSNGDSILIVADGVQAAVSTQKTSIRFINLSPDAPALDLTIVGGTSVTTNKGYKSFSTYAEFDAKKYSFEIKDSTTGAVKATLTDLDLVAGRLYTIIARGLVNPGTNEQPFTAQSIIN